MRSKLALAGVLLAAFACGDSDFVCTLIACISGLSISFTTAPTSPYRIEASTASASGIYAFDCTDLTRCSKTPFLDGLVAEVAIVKVTYQGRTTSVTVQPTYSNVFPNGEKCGGACKQGSVSIALP